MGAKNQNLDSLLVTDGIHRDVNSEKSVDKAKLNDLIKKKKITPTYYIRDLIF
jgi:ribonucleotide monophosphatase NagD (HAD superfamily)